MYHTIRNTRYAIRDTQYAIRNTSNGPSTSVEDSLQINLFMQNKPNFRKSQMNVNIYYTMDYKNIIPLAGQKNKPNCRKSKNDAKSVFTMDYRKKDDFSVRINKPNFRNDKK